MANMMKKLFRGMETPAEEKKEAKALKSGKITPKQYVAGEKAEGHGAGAAKKAAAIKSGKMSPASYAAKHEEKSMKSDKKVKRMMFGGLASGPIRRTQPAPAQSPAMQSALAAARRAQPAPAKSPAMQSALAAARRTQPAPAQSPAMQSALAAARRTQPAPAGQKTSSLGRMAKGGKVDGCAVKGKTRAKRG